MLTADSADYIDLAKIVEELKDLKVITDDLTFTHAERGSGEQAAYVVSRARISLLHRIASAQCAVMTWPILHRAAAGHRGHKSQMTSVL